MGWGAVAEELLEGAYHALARGEHWVGDDERLAVEAWRRGIAEMDLDTMVLVVGTECGHEAVVRSIEDVEDALVHRETRTEDCPDDDVVLRELDGGGAEGRRDILWFVG